MHILQIPTDVFHIVLYYSILARGVPRALRLKLVCKAFYHAFQPALFESRALEDFTSETERLAEWPIRRYHGRIGAHEFWHSYLVYRARKATDPADGRFVQLRQITSQLCTEAGADWDRTLDTLCWLALEFALDPWHHYTGFWKRRKNPNASLNEQPELELSLLGAAAYSNCLALAKRLLLKGHCPASDSCLFPSALQLAAWAGNRDMLGLFQEHLPEYEHIRSDKHYDHCWRGKAGPGSITGGAMRGDLEILRLALYPPSSARKDFWEDKARRSERTMTILYAQTTNIEVFDHICSLLANPLEKIVSDLSVHAEYGNLNMVKALLDRGAEAQGTNTENPLLLAARAGHEDVVDLLLERGADPNFSTYTHRSRPVWGAITGGSLSILRKLLDHGVDIHGVVGTKALWRAVNLEHTAMVQLLLSNGVGKGYELALPRVLEEAQKHGLDSMVEILEEAIEKANVPSRSPIPDCQNRDSSLLRSQPPPWSAYREVTYLCRWHAYDTL
ncbi:putative Multiple ankyrin repeats single kh domain protein [Seiridium cardinale]